jgi:multiple sugar transport system substrate-binding protein
MVAAPSWQAGPYVQCGGQPGHLTAWQNEDANRMTNNFFTNLLPAMCRGYMRPRYNGYLTFQDRAGEPIRRFLTGTGNPDMVIKEMNELYKNSLQKNK